MKSNNLHWVCSPLTRFWFNFCKNETHINQFQNVQSAIFVHVFLLFFFFFFFISASTFPSILCFAVRIKSRPKQCCISFGNWHWYFFSKIHLKSTISFLDWVGFWDLHFLCCWKFRKKMIFQPITKMCVRLEPTVCQGYHFLSTLSIYTCTSHCMRIEHWQHFLFYAAWLERSFEWIYALSLLSFLCQLCPDFRTVHPLVQEGNLTPRTYLMEFFDP